MNPDWKNFLLSAGGSFLVLLLDKLSRKLIKSKDQRLLQTYNRIKFYVLHSILLCIMGWLYWAYPETRTYTIIAGFLSVLILLLKKGKSQIGEEFEIRNIKDKPIQVNKLSYPEANKKLILTWETFGKGIENLRNMILRYSPAIDPDVYLGVNEAGLAIATFISSSLNRKKIGYIKTGGINSNDERIINISDCFFPDLSANAIVAIVDFELKTGKSIKKIRKTVCKTYPNAKIYYFVMGASTVNPNLKIRNVRDLSAAAILQDMEMPELLVYVMTNRGIEPPITVR